MAAVTIYIPQIWVLAWYNSMIGCLCEPFYRGWIALSLLQVTSALGESLFRMDDCVLSCFSCVQPFATLWIVTLQAPLSMGFPSKNTGVGCHALLQGIFPTQGSNVGWIHMSLYWKWECLFFKGITFPSDKATGRRNWLWSE